MEIADCALRMALRGSQQAHAVAQYESSEAVDLLNMNSLLHQTLRCARALIRRSQKNKDFWAGESQQLHINKPLL